MIESISLAAAIVFTFAAGLFLGAGLWASATKSAEIAFAAGQREALEELKAMRANLERCTRDDGGECCETFDDEEFDEEGEEWKRK